MKCFRDPQSELSLDADNQLVMPNDGKRCLAALLDQRLAPRRPAKPNIFARGRKRR